ncbi:hypothetical protein AB1K84_06715 [Mesobacillus foraminis]|uniref:Uncharacterized protein n=1 Tax=Mesobacillus foraminis TaxID=279826 RepID=A0A4R2B973_9BACI|nr:hypothetical protein [Mesobacillus foraminis]TCN23096.1 hypothetical protein EV146_109255 [Mesobacillus foraminis]
MKELVGECIQCGKEVFCLDGFLNGSVDDQQQLLCFECDGAEDMPKRVSP